MTLVVVKDVMMYKQRLFFTIFMIERKIRRGIFKERERGVREELW